VCVEKFSLAIHCLIATGGRLVLVGCFMVCSIGFGSFYVKLLIFVSKKSNNPLLLRLSVEVRIFESTLGGALGRIGFTLLYPTSAFFVLRSRVRFDFSSNSCHIYGFEREDSCLFSGGIADTLLQGYYLHRQGRTFQDCSECPIFQG